MPLAKEPIRDHSFSRDSFYNLLSWADRDCLSTPGVNNLKDSHNSLCQYFVIFVQFVFFVRQNRSKSYPSQF